MNTLTLTLTFTALAVCVFAFVRACRVVIAYRAELARVTAHRDHWQTLARSTLAHLADTVDEMNHARCVASCVLADERVALRALSFIVNAHENGDAFTVSHALASIAYNDDAMVDTDDENYNLNATRRAVWGAFVSGALD